MSLNTFANLVPLVNGTHLDVFLALWGGPWRVEPKGRYAAVVSAEGQGLTLVHFSPQPEPFLTQRHSR